MAIRSVLIHTLLIACCCCGAFATDYHVATDGDDANGGTGWGDALLTISNAVAKATNASDIVTVSNGTYDISAQILITNAITVRSYMDGVYGGL